jgi:hypothetical protein
MHQPGLASFTIQKKHQLELRLQATEVRAEVINSGIATSEPISPTRDEHTTALNPKEVV